jgi:zinc/manganese transport system substrate-binding protein
VTSHDSLQYFAARYGFEILGTVIPTSSTLAETSPAQLEALADVITERDVRTLFAETQHSTDDTEALAERVGDVAVITLLTGTLDPEGDAATYVEFLRHNAELIVTGLR